MVLTYAITSIIILSWLIKMIVHKKIIFQRTPLDVPILLFLVSQILSTIVSIDRRTSIFGYYSRFNGGLLSTISYTLLYFSFVSNMTFEKTLKSIKILLVSASIVCTWGILEHFGHSLSCLIIPDFGTFDTSCWVQDVQNRVFATFGQPNWLAAWITALIPFTFIPIINPKPGAKIKNFLLWFGLSCLFFLTLIYTKSRSGLLGFALAEVFFWAGLASSNIRIKLFTLKDLAIKFSILNFAFLILALINGAILIPTFSSFSNLLSEKELKTTNSTSLSQAGGTESAEIRKIVWRGAIDIWKSYPILGSGVETFAYSYYLFKPIEHNLTSEWDYLYNKAHNEYLNYLATTGIIGLISYLILILLSIYQIMKVKIQNLNIENTIGNLKPKTSTKVNKFLDLSSELFLFRLAVLSGYLSILVTNFFGFSVVPVALLFFLYPSFVIALQRKEVKKQETEILPSTLNNHQKIGITLVLSTGFFTLFLIGKYWYSDYLYASAKVENDSGNPLIAMKNLEKAISFNPKEAVYWDELANASLNLALYQNEKQNNDIAKKFGEESIEDSRKAINLSPANVNLRRNLAQNLIKLSILEPKYLKEAIDILETTIKLAPTDAKLSYNLSIAYLRTGDYEKAIRIMQKTTTLKQNYRDAHYALALMYIDVGEKDKAQQELKFILEKINPEDIQAKRELDELTK